MLNALLKRFTGHKPSKDAAKKRLQFALVCDQLEVNDSTLKNLQADIIEVISRYFEIDRKSLQLQVQRDKDVSALVFNTPILCVKKDLVSAVPDRSRRKSYKKKKK
jgi:cell division topological specificity factor